jgi:hypothetical protein
VCININGEMIEYFKTYNGLRQGDPLSPIMFNLVVEALATMMRKAANQGKIRGVMTHLIPEGITHIQYADDTILMIEGDDSSIINMKFILYCFKWFLGLKINYHKSGAYIFGMEQGEQRKIANMLNCRLGELPIKYLGIPISDTRLGKEDFVEILEKISKRIPPWKGKHSSLGGQNDFDKHMPIEFTYIYNGLLLATGGYS